MKCTCKNTRQQNNYLIKIHVNLDICCQSTKAY